MPDTAETLSVRTVDAIAQVGRDAWNRCAGDDNPFVCFDFLDALEESGSVTAKTGWLPQHAVLEDASGDVLAVAPMYLKNHSFGEYVFDHGWADAYERAGGRYYPKLQLSVPFTPVTGPRLLTPPGPNRDTLRRALLTAIIQVAEKIGVSNFHVTFATEEEAEIADKLGLLVRRGYQYHWHNRGYETFDDFLGELSSRKRKSIRKERRAVAEAGLITRALTGADLSNGAWDIFYQFYQDTYDRKWGSPYLTRAFFDIVTERIPDKVVLMLTEKDGVPVAGALNFRGKHALYGRNWGCAVDFKFLHFETCYYQAIDFAIRNGLQTVEAGTQGPHKVQRGYLPVGTWSFHWLRDQGFSDAVERFLDHERPAIEDDMHAMMQHSPYRDDRMEQAGEASGKND